MSAATVEAAEPSFWGSLTVSQHQRDMANFGLILTHSGKHVYEGTVSPKTIAQRRAANKVARRQRRINRGGAR